ncbi:Pentatricopeptide repeat-containing protein [Apostasia shenzhenica]|uniref:Pentatricopeptide repeat-containing protein n=1 Tax=Apostasia shenzhenica TaxID=1088818 RepID=A0A2I0AWJ6_9ASPA|nr:Pentatricopeptide repeat-containing protein [Apostasia shenzhenica]
MPSVAAHSRSGACATLRHISPTRLTARKTTLPPPQVDQFMRDTVHKISSILRSWPWDTAQEELRCLPIRWDSFTVNRVLKTHPPMEKAWLFFNWAARLPDFKHDHFTYTTMLDIFGEAGRIASMRQILQEMEVKRVRIDAATYTSVMHWLAKDGDFDGAVAAWEEMRQRRRCQPTAVSYTAFMKVLFDHGRPMEAAEVYREMIEKGLRPNCHTYTVMMEYLASSGKIKDALEMMNEMQEAGIQPDKATCNILVHKCSMAGETSAITQILQFMKENSIVLRRPVFLEALEAFRTSGDSDHLLKEVNPHLAFEGIEEENCDFDIVSDDPNSLTDRGIILNFLIRRSFVALDHLLHEIIDKEIQIMDSKLLSAIVLANCENFRLSGALLAFRYSSKANKKLDRSAYISLIGIFTRAKSYETIVEIVDEMLRVGIQIGSYLLLLIIYNFGSAGLFKHCTRIFAALQEDQNNLTYTALMNAFFEAGEVEKGLHLYSRMKMESIPVSIGTYEVLISGLERAGRFHDANIYRVEKRSLERNDFPGCKFSTDNVFCDRFFGSCKVFDLYKDSNHQK